MMADRVSRVAPASARTVEDALAKDELPDRARGEATEDAERELVERRASVDSGRASGKGLELVADVGTHAVREREEERAGALRVTDVADLLAGLGVDVLDLGRDVVERDLAVGPLRRVSEATTWA